MPPEALSIGELARRVEVTPDTLRYYEETGLLASPRRDEGGRRRYPESAVAVVGVIRALRGAGFSIREIRGVLGAKKPGRGAGRNARQVEAALEGLRAAVQERRAALDVAEALLDEWLAEVRAYRATRGGADRAAPPGRR